MSRTSLRISGVVVVVLAAVALWANAPSSPLAAGAKADLLVVSKGDRQLLAYSHGILLRSYRVSLGREPVGCVERICCPDRRRSFRGSNACV
jgi:hypothetical protein